MGYIPSRDADLINWGDNFSTLLTADPSLYGINASLAAVNQSQYDEFVAAYNLAVDPATKTIVTVAFKDEEREGFLSLARQIAAIIRSDNGVSDASKAALGLTIPDPTPTPVPVPTTQPIIVVPFAGTGQVLMNITDELTPNKKAKPAGVQGCLLFRAYGAALPLSFDDAKLISIPQRSDNIIDTSEVTPGMQTTYWGKWFNSRGEIGPLGPGASIVAV